MAQRKREEGSGGRLLSVLGLFTVERPEWAVEEAAKKIGVSATTTYRYFKHLTKAGLITPVSGANYTLGPGITQMDRQIQMSDPMLRSARSVMNDLISYHPDGSVILLCRLFHDRVMPVHHLVGREPQEPGSFERGRLVPLYRGAASKIILANLPSRKQKLLFAHDAKEIVAAGLGRNWDDFRANLAALRKAGVAVSKGEVDRNRVGVAAAVFDGERAVLGSLCFVLNKAHSSETLIGRVASLTVAGAREIELAMNRDSKSTRSQAGPARLKIARSKFDLAG